MNGFGVLIQMKFTLSMVNRKAAGTSREEAVQIAAVALQIIEYYDRVIDW